MAWNIRKAAQPNISTYNEFIQNYAITVTVSEKYFFIPFGVQCLMPEEICFVMLIKNWERANISAH